MSKSGSSSTRSEEHTSELQSPDQHSFPTRRSSDLKRLRPLYKGLRKTIQRGTFASLKTPCPPRDEQDAIVRFLDYATGRIERAIRAKKKLIALLNEQKRVIIHQIGRAHV